jgi:hypothetical protein
VKVLQLQQNIGPQISIHVRALRDLGVEVRGLMMVGAAAYGSECLETPPVVPIRRHPIRGVLARLALWRMVAGALRWADVVHWRYGIANVAGDHGLLLRYLARLNKACLVDFCGSDIRINEIACADNPYFREVVERGETRPGQGSRERSLARQRLFAEYGFECILRRFEMLPYLDKRYFPSPYLMMSPTFLEDYEPKYPDPNNPRPVVVHSPTHKGLKGTSAVLAAVERLKQTHEFEFQLIHGVEHAKALEMVRNCDIMLDQFVIGEYANAAAEAMAFGKPTFCYMLPSVLPYYPPDLPIVNANPDNLAEVLGPLLVDGPRRRDLGRRGRAYVEQHHDARKLARDLIGIYEELLRRKGRRV